MRTTSRRRPRCGPGLRRIGLLVLTIRAKRARRSIRVGTLLGEGEPEKAKQAGLAGVGLSFVVGLDAGGEVMKKSCACRPVCFVRGITDGVHRGV